MTAVGLTWDHPRGRDALVEIARRANAGRDMPLIEWVAQPLEGFESAPIASLAAEQDLLVLDHPHIGEAIAEGCLIPLEALYSVAQIARWRAQSVGAAMTSYQWEGQHWALPLDVASQVTARAPRLVTEAPDSWDAMIALARTVPVAQSLAGPHAILTLFSIAASDGVLVGGEGFLGDEAAHHALERMHHLWSLRPPGSEALNPIGLLEAMAAGEIAVCPLIFGYVTYARPGPSQLVFSNPPGGGAGGVLGGTGLAITRRARPTTELLGHVASLMETTTQSRLIPTFGGQPSARAAWTDVGVNRDWGGFYSDTLASVEHAVLRPRYDGYVEFQTRASSRLREALATREAPDETLAALRGLWSAARNGARGSLDDERHLQ